MSLPSGEVLLLGLSKVNLLLIPLSACYGCNDSVRVWNSVVSLWSGMLTFFKLTPNPFWFFLKKLSQWFGSIC